MKYPKILEHKCKICNGDIIANRSRDLNKEFCGPACVGKFYRTKEKEYTNCLTCNKEFEKTCKTQNIYCSTECYHKSQSIVHKRNCKKCGEEFTLKNIADEKRGKGKYCSIECSTRKYEFNETFFKKIDTEEKAYWLGFIYADGCLDARNELRLHVSKKDKTHIQKFKKQINSNHPIHNCQLNTISLNICSKKMASYLKKLGVIPAKTFILEYPKIPKKFNNHFIRGVFDGDGCIYKRKDGIKTWSIYTASEKFKNQLINIINSETGINVFSYKQGNGYTLRIFRKNDIPLIGEYMYKNSTIFLERKKEKF